MSACTQEKQLSSQYKIYKLCFKKKTRQCPPRLLYSTTDLGQVLNVNAGRRRFCIAFTLKQNVKIKKNIKARKNMPAYVMYLTDAVIIVVIYILKYTYLAKITTKNVVHLASNFPRLRLTQYVYFIPKAGFTKRIPMHLQYLLYMELSTTFKAA